jgi:hypothetical protein
MDKDLLVQVIVNTGDEKVRCGTAYPIAPGRVITAAHVVGDAQPNQIEVSWYHQSKSERGWKPCKSIVWKRPDVDVIVLEVDCPNSVKSRFAVLGESEPRTDIRWESEGFPLVGKRGDDWVAISMKGATFSMGNQSELFELGVDSPPSSVNGWQGASGSPVFVNGNILGVIVVCPKDFANGRLSAVPAYRLLKDDSFRAAVELTEDEQRRLLVLETIQLLAKSREALQTLAKRLKVPELADDQKWSRSVVEKLLELGSPPQILTAMIRAMNDLDKQGLKGVADILEQVAYYVAPAALSNSHVKQITVIVESKEGRFAFPAKTKMFVEIAMARINGRKTDFRVVAAQTDMPHGKFCLSNPPEPGMDQEHDAFIADFVAELSRMIGADLLSDKQHENVRAINAELDAQFELYGWQYYYVCDYRKHEAERRKRMALAVKLDKLFPRIAFIGLDRADAPQEELDTVIRMMHILCRAAGIEYKPHGTN